MERTLIVDTAGKSGEKVTISGWVHARRDMGKIIFIDLRDATGLIQVVFFSKDVLEVANQLRPEFCISITGTVQDRPEKLWNEKMVTGKIELGGESIEILNEAKTPPFEIDKDTSSINEELRLKYRYLDLRSERMTRNTKMRAEVTHFIRDWLHGKRFNEIETPILTKGTPEGAREFMVPSRIHPGKFYVLPQSPQQFKQLLMVGGFERYFQIARCFRDEDQRGDRQPEFTQFDMEMSFVDNEEQVMAVTEEMMKALVKKLAPHKKVADGPFPRMTYAEAEEKYQSDKPDIRENKEDADEFAFLWVVDFPLMEYSETEGRLTSAHHPFTAPKEEDEHMLESEPAKVRAKAYDLVLNGYELGGGSIRIHKRDLQNKIFEVLGLEPEEIEAKFGHILEAFEFGAPPHGGIAWGLDRLIMLLVDEPNIREVITFPKTGDARDPLMGAPAEVAKSALAEANVDVRL